MKRTLFIIAFLSACSTGSFVPPKPPPYAAGAPAQAVVMQIHMERLKLDGQPIADGITLRCRISTTVGPAEAVCVTQNGDCVFSFPNSLINSTVIDVWNEACGSKTRTRLVIPVPRRRAVRA